MFATVWLDIVFIPFFLTHIEATEAPLSFKLLLVLIALGLIGERVER